MLSRSPASSFCSLVCSVSSISILYFFAKYFMASGYVKCSCSIKKDTTVPPFPLEKSFQICFTGDTIKLGVRSSLKGLRPLKLEPDFLRFTKSPITSSTRAVSNTWSMVDFDIKMVYYTCGNRSLFVFWFQFKRFLPDSYRDLQE